MENIAPSAARELPPADAGAGDSREPIRAMDPLQYPGWDSLLADHGGSTFFHGSAWARVLHDTYGHRPFYFGRIVEGRLEGLLPIMEVSSPLTGRRGVSLPFTDFCPPLEGGDHQAGELYEAAVEKGKERGWRYLECRSNGSQWAGASPSLAFYSHSLNLKRAEEELFASLKSRARTPIRRAQEAGVVVSFETSREAMQSFYGLHCQTRRKHGLPPQPSRFFDNIHRHALAKGLGWIALARCQGQIAAAAVFLHFCKQAIHKFGASDIELRHLSANHLLLWETIRRYRNNGFDWLDFGRTSLDNEGLRLFKRGFSPLEQEISYCRYDLRAKGFVIDHDRAQGRHTQVFRSLPPTVLRWLGRLLYPHLS